jgi:CheY-like chemotaxis protein
MKGKSAKLATILLVEDNEGDILLTLEAFEEYKIKTDISVVKNGRQALDFLFQRGKFANAKKPDLILLDINLPIFSGHGVLAQIKSDQNPKKIPVIMLTTSSNQRDMDKAYENHCNSYAKNRLKSENFWKLF